MLQEGAPLKGKFLPNGRYMIDGTLWTVHDRWYMIDGDAVYGIIVHILIGDDGLSASKEVGERVVSYSPR